MSDLDVYPGPNDPDRTHRLGPTEPDALRRRPHRGKLPIPWITYVAEDGRPDFRVHVESKRRRVEEDHLCQLCGERMGEEVVFVGLSAAMAAWGETGPAFGEPPMHRECLDYALEVCPWLSGRDYADREYPGGTKVGARPGDARDLIIYTCEDFSTRPDPSGQTDLVYVPGWAVKPVEWYRRPEEVLS